MPLSAPSSPWSSPRPVSRESSNIRSGSSNFSTELARRWQHLKSRPKKIYREDEKAPNWYSTSPTHSPPPTDFSCVGRRVWRIRGIPGSPESVVRGAHVVRCRMEAGWNECRRWGRAGIGRARLGVWRGREARSRAGMCLHIAECWHGEMVRWWDVRW